MATRHEGESKDILIKHLRVELEDLRASSRKMEELNTAAIALENNYRVLKEEKERAELDGQTKTVSVMEGIREAESELKELKEEQREGEKRRNELLAQLQKLKAELDILEQKETSIDGKLNEMTRVIDEAAAQKETSDLELDAKRREVAELRARLTAVEKDQAALDERIGKMRLSGTSQSKELIDLAGERKKLEEVRAARAEERDRLNALYAAREGEFAGVGARLTGLEERRGYLEAEMKRMQIACKELEIKRLEEEETREGISTTISAKECRMKELSDAVVAEREAKERAGASLNDAREESERLQNEHARLTEALKRISNTYTRLTCSLEQMKLESLELARSLNHSDMVDEVRVDIERLNQAASALITKQ